MRGKVAAAAAVFVFATMIGWAGAGSALASTTYNGRATAVAATASSVTQAFADTGELPGSGGALDAAELAAGVPDTVSVETLHASTIGQGTYTHSEASAGSVVLTSGLTTIAADLVMSEARAENHDGWIILEGESHVDGLLLNGVPVPVTGDPNQIVPLLGGQLILNEQVSSTSGSMKTITVNALHLQTADADIRLGSSRAGMTEAPPPSSCAGGADFVTGGGWIVPAGQMQKATFGFVGGLKADGTLHGHLVFKNPALDDRVKGDVTAYIPGTANERTMFGAGELNRRDANFVLRVIDDGEPSDDDFFEVSYSDVDGDAGDAGGTLGGGNIQLHPAC